MCMLSTNTHTQGYDQLALRMHSNNCGASMLQQLRDVVDSALSDMIQEGPSDDRAAIRAGLDDGLAGTKKKRARVLGGATGGGVRVKTEPLTSV
jgi:hypothetical protein